MAKSEFAVLLESIDSRRNVLSCLDKCVVIPNIQTRFGRKVFSSFKPVSVLVGHSLGRTKTRSDGFLVETPSRKRLGRGRPEIPKLGTLKTSLVLASLYSQRATAAVSLQSN